VAPTGEGVKRANNERPTGPAPGRRSMRRRGLRRGRNRIRAVKGVAVGQLLVPDLGFGRRFETYSL